MTATQRFAEFTQCLDRCAQLEHIREMRRINLEERQLCVQEEQLWLQQANPNDPHSSVSTRQDYGRGATYMDGNELCRDIPHEQW